MSSSLVGPTSGCSNRPSTISRAAFWIYSCARWRSEEHTSELQSRLHLVCRLLLEKKKNNRPRAWHNQDSHRNINRSIENCSPYDGNGPSYRGTLERSSQCIGHRNHVARAE